MLTTQPTDSSTRAATSTALMRVRALGWVGFVLGVYALTRIFTLVVVLVAGRHQIAMPPSATGHSYFSLGQRAAPGYETIMTNWDGQWYREIVARGYPTILPRRANGQVLQSDWTFYPLFPFVVGAVMAATGLSFTLVGPTVALVLGAAAMVVLFRLVDDVLGTAAARLAVVFTCTFVSAPVLQAAYTESLALLLVCSCLLLLRRRRYGWTAVVIVLLALTRNVILPMSVVIVVHGLVRWRSRAGGEFTRRDRVAVGGLAVLCVAATGIWPLIAAVVTGDVGAYTETTRAWGMLHPLVGWVGAFHDSGGIPGMACFLLLLGCLYIALAAPAARRWGPELWGWAVAYPAYLVLATNFFASSLRYLLLAFPLSLLLVNLLRRVESPVVRVAMTGLFVCFGLFLQWIWITRFFIVTGTATSLYP